jgi:hypothetical protein
MFYNGFNLLIDTILGFTVWFFTRRVSWWDGYHAGIEDTTNNNKEKTNGK